MKPGVLQSWHGPSVEKTGEPDINYQYGDGCQRSDARVLNLHLPKLLEELERRGYDLDTFSFRIAKKAP